ncbi:integrase [Streptomyces broussonetiae]|uniref:Integrase n=1 Tax=Streptomyces broussonetiae TaxID=2686304 RepID=A0A6I6N3K7_9ACTN|nr:integrase [Streptomyces broussonetiae]QHA04630.1 integrase [Streptomyces broussonetiae]
MTALLDLPSLSPDPAVAFITSDRLPPGAGPVARYGDQVWCLHPLIENPGGVRCRIYWANFPSGLREECRFLAYRLINEPVPALYLVSRAGAWRERLSPYRIHKTVLHWAELARWCHKHGITTLRDFSEDAWHDYHQFVRAKGLSRSSVCHRLTAMQRLWIFDHTSPHPLGIAEPPWSREGSDDYLPAATALGENATEPITPATMGPLLIWALRMVEDFADDVLAAWAEYCRMTARPRHNPAANEMSRPTLLAYFRELESSGRPVPTIQWQGRTAFATTYIAALTGASNSQVQHALESNLRWQELKRTRPGGCPMPCAVTGMIDGRPWTDAVDFDEVGGLMRHLGTACFIVIAYLTGMRPGEVLGLHEGCCPEPEPGGRHLIYGHEFKTARDKDGNHLSRGRTRDVPWVAIAPVVAAIRVLERIVPSEALLFDSYSHQFLIQRKNAKRALTLYSFRDRVEHFAHWASDLAVSLDRPHEVIPADPEGLIGTARFRRTLAWHIARRPGGLVALAIQYGHMRTAVSAAYASRSRDGIHDLLDIEMARATAETLATLHDDLAVGTGVSGPAARRLIHAATQAPTFVGVITTARQARALLSNPALAVHDNPHAFAMCVYNRDKALCRRIKDDDSPRLDSCVPTCANIGRLDHHAVQLGDQAEDLERQADSGGLPFPLAERLRGQAMRLREYADLHHSNRTTARGEPA